MKQKFEEGDIVEIIGHGCDHGFKKGVEVRIAGYRPNTGNYKAEYLDGSDWWHIKETDAKLVKPKNNKMKKEKLTTGMVAVMEDDSINIVLEGICESPVLCDLESGRYMPLDAYGENLSNVIVGHAPQFEIKEVYGSFDKESFSSNSKRIIFVCQKKNV